MNNKKLPDQQVFPPKIFDAQHNNDGQPPCAVLGKDAKENNMLFHSAQNNDWWIHAKSYPSAHGWIRSQRFPLKEVKKACLRIKHQSKRLRQMDHVVFTVTKRKHLELGDALGEVLVLRTLREIKV